MGPAPQRPDQERRRRSDARLDDLERRVRDVEDHTDALVGLLETVKGLSRLIELQDRRLSDLRSDLRENLRAVNQSFADGREDIAQIRREMATARNVQNATDEIKQSVQSVAPSRLDWALKFATIVSLLLIPILAAYVAARGGP